MINFLTIFKVKLISSLISDELNKSIGRADKEERFERESIEGESVPPYIYTNMENKNDYMC